MLLTGSHFLTDLKRRALADERLQLCTTGSIMLLALLASRLDFEGGERLVLAGGPWAVVIVTAGLASWLAAAIAINYYTRQFMRHYTASLLTDSGLLYVVLEHEPAEYLPIGRVNPVSQTLKVKSLDLSSFKGRMKTFLRKYYLCATCVGFHGAPRQLRISELAVSAALILLALCFGWQITGLLRQALNYGVLDYSPAIRAFFLAVIVLVLVRSTLQLARKTGLWLGLTDVLLPLGAGERAHYSGD